MKSEEVLDNEETSSWMRGKDREGPDESMEGFQAYGTLSEAGMEREGGGGGGHEHTSTWSIDHRPQPENAYLLN